MTSRLPLLISACAILLFFAFGLFHIAKFETTDEHFWKNERITQYYRGIAEGLRKSQWKKTRINDKPGVSIALVSGIGLPFAPEIESFRDRNTEKESGNFFTVYRTENAERINFALRFPLLLVNVLLLFYLFWVIKRSVQNAWVAACTLILIALSPVLVGISQVINPDALLWSIGAAALFSYLALLSTNEKKFIALTGIFLGFALLSKYTANILLLLFLFLLFARLLFTDETIDYKDVLRKQYAKILAITLSAWAIFALLMPAVFHKPRHFLYGTLFSPVLEPLLIPLGVACIILLTDLFLFHAKGTAKIIGVLKKFRIFFLRMFAAIMLFLVALALLNAWTGTPFFSLDNIKEEAYWEGDLVFAQITSENPFLRTVLATGIQSQNMIFSLPPLFLLLLCIGWIMMLLGRWPISFGAPALIITCAPVLFFVGGLASDVFVNPRYGILLYPLLAFLAALTIGASLPFFRRFFPFLQERVFWIIACGILIASGVIALWHAKPFYLTYESSLLPKKYFIGDSWGYGSYEAARYLNALPHARDLVIWSDRSGVCQFFIGKCVRDYKINLDETVPDYFVFSRRGILRHPFLWDPKANKKPRHAERYYYEKMQENPSWTFMMNDRAQNFVTIVGVEER